MHRLGHWYTWTTLERPHGLHFFLDLREAEQRDIAKDIIKLACKTSMGAKAQAKQQGSTQVCVVGSVCLRLVLHQRAGIFVHWRKFCREKG